MLGDSSVNIARETELYIEQHPSIRDCLGQDIINFSKLARNIREAQGIKNFEAVVIACRRFKEKLRQQHASLERKLQKLLSTSKIEVKNRIAVVVIEKTIYFDYLIELEKAIKRKGETYHSIEGSDTITIITSELFLEDIAKNFKHRILKITKNLIEVALKTEETIEDTPGWMAYLTTRLAENNINIIETMSAWTETIFVLHEKDIGKAMELLKF